MMARDLRSALGVLIVGLWCAGCSTGPPPSKPFTLPSGKVIGIEGMAPTHLPSGEAALVLNCTTETSIDDMTNLRKEADEIWDARFKAAVERARMKAGVIRMMHYEVGFLETHGKGYGFLFKKRADGKWEYVDVAKK